MVNQQYYEAIVQLRPRDEELITYVRKQLLKTTKTYISKQIDKKFGIDLYLGSWRYAIALGRKLKRVFKGELIISRRLYGVSKETSKDLYRVTVLFRKEEPLLKPDNK